MKISDHRVEFLYAFLTHAIRIIITAFGLSDSRRRVCRGELLGCQHMHKDYTDDFIYTKTRPLVGIKYPSPGFSSTIAVS